MTRTILAILLAAALLAIPGLAAASPCPRCNPGSGDNWWSEAGVGAAHGPNADAGLALAHHDDKKGFWSYFSVCFDAVGDKLAQWTHLPFLPKGKASVYADQHGVDVNAKVAGQDYDKLPVAGQLDDKTWQLNAQARSTLHGQGVDVPTVQGPPTEKLPSTMRFLCLRCG